MELPIRKPVNTRKGKRFHTAVVKSTKFEKENYWKGRKNRALQQLSRETHESDQDDFLLPEPNVNRWEVYRAANLKQIDKAIWHEAGRQLAECPPHLGLGWGEMPACTTWTICSDVQHFYTDELMKQSIYLKKILNIPIYDTYDMIDIE